MDQVWAVLSYASEHPGAVIGAVLGLIAVYALLNRKPKRTREADARVEQLRRERDDHYKKLRPLG